MLEEEEGQEIVATTDSGNKWDEVIAMLIGMPF